MSFKSDRKARWKLSIGLTGSFLLIFVVTSLALYFATSLYVRQAMEEEWAVRQSRVQERITTEGGVHTHEITLTEHETSAAPTPEMQAAVERHFDRFLPLVMVPIVLVGLLGGLFLTYRSTHPLQSVIRTVQHILDTGEIGRRVPVARNPGPLGELASLFNHLLDKNEALIAGFQESLDHVAHDLRTPMTRLRATAETALGSRADPEVCHTALADCLEESEHVLRALNGLMDVAEAEAGTVRLDLEEVPVAQVVGSVLDLYEFVAEERNVSLDARVEEGLRARADGSRLRQVLANLVDNAVKYSNRGGEVTVEAHARGPEVVLSITDRGQGIPPEEIPRIFDRLYRGDRSRHERGLGLGLTYVRAMVEAQGGSVDAVSRPGEGSTFTVRLPRTG